MALTERQFIYLALTIKSKGCCLFDDSHGNKEETAGYSAFGLKLFTSRSGGWALAVIKKDDSTIARRQVLSGDASYEVLDRELESEVKSIVEENLGCLPDL